MRSIFTTILLGCLTLNFAIAQCQGSDDGDYFVDADLVRSNYSNKNTWVDAQHMAAIYKKCISAQTRMAFLMYRNSFYDIYCYNDYGDSASFCSSAFFGPFCAALQQIEDTKFPKDPNVEEYFDRNSEDQDADGVANGFDLDPNFIDMRLYNLQGYMINSLSTFLANRFKDEATNMALKSLFKRMVKEDSMLVAALFPRTFRYVNTLLDEGSYYTADIMQMRQIIGMDLKSLDKSFEANKERLFPNFNEYPAEHTIFDVTLNLLQRSETTSRRAFLNSLPRLDYESDRKYLDWLDFNRMLSEAITDYRYNSDYYIEYHEQQPSWISLDRIRPGKMQSDTSVLFFYGLLESQIASAYKANAHIKFYGSVDSRATSMWQLLAPFEDKPIVLKSDYQDSSSIMIGLNYVNEAVNYMRFLTANKDIQASFGMNPNSFEMANQVLELTRAFRMQRYQEALNVLSLYFFKYVGGSLKDLHSISFLIQFAQVQNMEQMRYLIESYALPIGASSIKRHSKFNVSLNAYVGATGGYETAYGSKQTQSKWNVGLTAPIGVSTTFANGHLTGFVSILDLGSMVNQRLNNDTTAYSNLKFEQFTAPGVGLFYNVKSSPITFGVMFNYIPNLRTITYNDGTATITETNTNVTRLNFSLLMDIPLFTLYNRK